MNHNIINMTIFSDCLTFEEGNEIIFNKEGDEFFYRLDYDVRSEKINMDFQHFHNYYEMMILVDESAGHLIEGSYYSLQAGDIVLLNPGVLHKSIYFKGGPVRRVIISFAIPAHYGMDHSLRGILRMFATPDPIIRLEGSDRSRVFSILDSLFAEWKKRPSFFDMEGFAKLIDFLYTLSKVVKNNKYTPDAEFDPLTHKIYTVSRYIHEHYAEELSLELLSEQFFISSCYLSRKFKEIIGFTLVQYIQMTRVRRAQEALITTNTSIQRISEECGFSSFSQFNRVFSHFCSMPPLRFRKLGREGKADLFKLADV